MAILIDNKILFFHAPRTGGEWFISAITKTGINFQEIGNKHATYFSDHRLFSLVYENKVKTMTFIRHPAEWYKSYWELKSRARKHPWGIFEDDSIWHPTWDIDNECEAPNFNEFINKCVTKLPNYLSYLYDAYTRKPPIGTVDYIILTENLEKEIPTIFKENNIDINAELFKNTKSINTFKSNNFLYTEEELKMVIESERRSIEKFGFTKDINNLRYLIKD